MSKKRQIDANRVNILESSRALKRLRILRAEVEQIYWDTFVELLSLQPDLRSSPKTALQAQESKRENP